jgi:hypothetical protein
MHVFHSVYLTKEKINKVSPRNITCKRQKNLNNSLPPSLTLKKRE